MNPYENLVARLGIDPATFTGEQIAGLQVLADGKVPEDKIKQRDARGGQKLSYYPHPWARRLLRDALGVGAYSLETIEMTYHPGPYRGLPAETAEMLLLMRYPWLGQVGNEKKLAARVADAVLGVEGSTASALVRLTVYTPNGCSVVTEPGVFDNTMKLPEAAAMASASSRGVCRCMAQMFGLGAEFYGDEDGAMSWVVAWDLIRAHSVLLGLDEDVVKAALKEAGFKGEDLGTRYGEAVALVQGMAAEDVLGTGAETKTETEPAPKDLVIEAATDLGAEVLPTKEDADLKAALNGETKTDALAEEVKGIQHWGDFFALASTTMEYKGATDTRQDLVSLFGAGNLPVGEWERMYTALRQLKDAKGDAAQIKALRVEYGGLKAEK